MTTEKQKYVFLVLSTIPGVDSARFRGNLKAVTAFRVTDNFHLLHTSSKGDEILTILTKGLSDASNVNLIALDCEATLIGPDGSLPIGPAVIRTVFEKQNG